MKADKGNKLVIMNKEDYDEKLQNTINDSNFKILNRTPLPGMIRDSRNLIKSIQEIFAVPKWKLIVSNPEVPKLYALPKVHKPGGKLRNIVSNINSPSVKVAKWLVGELKKFPIESLSIKNSFDFVEKTKNIRIDDDEIMISFDVEALFPSIPVTVAILALKSNLDKYNIDDDKKRIYLETAKICMSHNFFQYRGRFYYINFGTSMGNPLSPLLAEVFMSSLEIDLKRRNLLPRIWYRYVDDVFAVVKRDEIDNILRIINSQFDSINFTYEREENNELPFLDLLVSRKENKSIDFAVYRKSTTTNRYITSDSFCPIQHKLAAFHSMVHRMCKLPLSVTNYLNEYQHLKKVANINGYNDCMIDNLIAKHTRKIRKSNLSTLFNQHKNLQDNNSERASMTYIPSITNLLQPKLRSKRIDCVFSSNGKIKNRLGTTKDKSMLLGKSGIYQITCEDCNETYIGQTKRNIGTRFKEHTSHIKYNRPEKSSVAAHALNQNHFNIKSENVKILKHCTNPRRLDAYESVYIHSHINLINTDFGNIISPLFDLV